MVWLKPLCTPRSWRLYSWFVGLSVFGPSSTSNAKVNWQLPCGSVGAAHLSDTSEFRKPSKSLSRTWRENPKGDIPSGWHSITSSGFMWIISQKKMKLRPKAKNHVLRRDSGFSTQYRGPYSISRMQLPPRHHDWTTVCLTSMFGSEVFGRLHLNAQTASKVDGWIMTKI